MAPPSHRPCGNLFDMKDGETCSATWETVRETLHPCQEAVGYSAVRRKIQQDYTTAKKAQQRMDEAGSVLPVVLGPSGAPYLIDAHHTTSALEASGHHAVDVTLKKVCDWSSLPPELFHRRMQASNFMIGVGRPAAVSSNDGTNKSGDPNELPVPINVAEAIPSTIFQLKDDPWRSLAALVRKVKDDKCPPGNKKCLRGYVRECRDDGSTTAFFEFRWAYFMNDAYLRGCKGDSYWDNPSDCTKFANAYRALLATNIGRPILDQDLKAWQGAAKLLVPLCRGRKAQGYTLPEKLDAPMGGESLPGCVSGRETKIEKEDPKCKPPKCPTLKDIPIDLLSKMARKYEKLDDR